MKKIIYILLFTAVLMLSVSCISEGNIPKIPSERENAEVVLRFRMPGNFAGQRSSRSAVLEFEDENRIKDVFVLVFDTSNNLVAIREADGETIDYTPGLGAGNISGTGEFTVSLTASENSTDLFRLVVIANAADIIAGRLGANPHMSPFLGSAYNVVMAALWKQFTGKIFQETLPAKPAMPMWGQTTTPVLIEPNKPVADPIQLTRAIARIDVGVGTVSGDSEQGYVWSGQNNSPTPQTIPFVLNRVYVMRPNNYFAIVPAGDTGSAWGTLPTARLGNPTIPVPAPAATTAFSVADSETNFNFVAQGGSIHRQIYMPEANVRTPQGAVPITGTPRPGDENHLNRMAIVVGGSYRGGAETYYRIDFTQNGTSLINVLRNHLYQINIMGVTGPGEKTPEDAYNSLAMNMQVEINDWVEVGLDEIILDGVRWIKLQRSRNEDLSRRAVLYRLANTTDELRFETNIPLTEWDLTLTTTSGVIDGTIIPNDVNFDTKGGTETLIRTIQNTRYTIQLIQVGNPRTVLENGQNILVYNGHFRFISRAEYNGSPSSILNVETGRISFPITITQKGDDPNDWNDGGNTDAGFGEDDDD
ncbi:MAG: hypothetical protein LBI15_09910 [Dysgonamonadaceae bacterium]|jgi:hypothetical protein|nr:hypothetical protein [Dysgonamonadaceae bacterium]